MAKTLQDILDDVAAYLDQDTTLATGTELTVRVNLIDQALREWGDSYQWKQLRVFNYAPSWALSATSMALPTNFKKLMSAPYDVSVNPDNEYPEIRAEDRFLKGSSDRYSIVGGNDASGRYLVINPALTSGVSLVLDYQSTPSSMATLADISVCPDANFLVKRTIANILSSRSDPRFPTLKAEADDSLANMIEEEATLSGGQNNTTSSWIKQNNFVIGRD